MKRVVRSLWETTISLNFTIAGMLIVVFTLSGNTRNIATIANGVALFSTYAWNLIKDMKDEEA
jgi:hypothetical protein